MFRHFQLVNNHCYTALQMTPKLFDNFSSKRPQWAKSLNRSQYSAFRGTLLTMSENKIDADKCSPLGILRYKGKEANLTNLAMLCSTLPPDEWEVEIKRWLKAIVTNDESVPKDTPLKISDLTLQLYPAGYFGGTNEQR